jgi:hypothetical protein
MLSEKATIIMTTQAINFGNSSRESIIPSDNVTGAKVKRLCSFVRMHNLVIRFIIGNEIPLSLSNSENINNTVIVISKFSVSVKLTPAKNGTNTAPK